MKDSLKKYESDLSSIKIFRIQTPGIKKKKKLKHNYSLKINNNLTTAGVCKYDERTIEISKLFLDNSTEHEIENIVLHELAHAITGPYVKKSHGEEWKIAAKAIGCDAKRTCKLFAKTSLYVVACRKGCYIRRHRLTQKLMSKKKWCQKHKIPMKLYKKKHKYKEGYIRV